MPVSYVSTPEAIAASGLRLVVAGAVPSPWGEAAKGIFHVKGLSYQATRLALDDPAQRDWAGHDNAPVAIWNDEAPLAGWADILALAERLAPDPCLLPKDHAGDILTLGAQILGPGGLCWQRRAHLIHLGLNDQGGFHPKVAAYLDRKYSNNPAGGAGAGAEVLTLLNDLSARLGSADSYLVGDRLTAADISLATALAIFAPLPEDQCAMHPRLRATFETTDPALAEALDPSLLAFRDRIYSDHLELPLSL